MPPRHEPCSQGGQTMGIRLTHLALAAALAVGLAACATPSVPIPPPEPESIVFEVDLAGGTARFAYDPRADYVGAVVYVFNRDAGQGVITVADELGGVAPTAPFPAQEGDEVVVTVELDNQIASTCVRLRDGRSSSSLECDL